MATSLFSTRVNPRLFSRACAQIRQAWTAQPMPSPVSTREERRRQANPPIPPPTPAMDAMNKLSASDAGLFHQVIRGRLREGGARALRRVRQSGRASGKWPGGARREVWIPTIFQGRRKYPDLLLQVEAKPFCEDYKRKLFAFERRVKWMLTGPLYELRIEGGGLDEYGNDLDMSHVPFERVRVLAHTIAIDPYSNQPIGVQLKYAPEDEPARVRIPIHPLNESTSPAFQNGGYLNEFFRQVDVRVDPYTKPPLFATVDVGHLDMKDRVKLKDLAFEGRGQGVSLILPDSTDYAIMSKVK